MPRPRHHASIEHHHRRARLFTALQASSSSAAMSLRSRMARCEGPDWGWRYTCRSPACPACRDRYIGAQRRAAQKRFAGVANSTMASLSLSLGAVREVEAIGTIMAKARRDLRNLIAKQRRASGRWNAVEVLAWLETDAVAADGVALLGPDKRTQIAEAVQIFVGDSDVLWLPSLHGLVHLGDLDVVDVQNAFAQQWKGHNAVCLKAFSDSRDITANAGSVINYALKHEATSTTIDWETGEITDVEWETPWLVAYHSWLHAWSRSFQSTRISVSPLREKVKDPVVSTDEGLEYSLPFICDFSAFPMDYNYWKL